MVRVTVTMADRGTAIMADQGTAIMAATPVLTADTPQRTTTAATLPHTTADIDRVTMLPPIMVPGTMALGTIGAGDRQARRLSRTTKGRRDVCDLFSTTSNGYLKWQSRPNSLQQRAGASC